MHWYGEVLQKYAVFNGRARRSEFWWFTLINAIVGAALGLIDTVIFGVNYGILSGLYGLAVLIPTIAVAVRRLHDTNRSGWWLLIGLIPLFGFIVLLIFYFQNSTPGSNRFGDNPKGVDAPDRGEERRTRKAA